MSALIDHARAMLAYNHWANGKILDAASKLQPDQFNQVSDTLAHTVGTQLYWHANWMGDEFEEPKGAISYDEMRALYERSDTLLLAYSEALTDDEWARDEAWWKRWGFEGTLPVGPTIFQVIYHGIQHRAEVAIILSLHGCSPGDLDNLVYLREQAAQSGLP